MNDDGDLNSQPNQSNDLGSTETANNAFDQAPDSNVADAQLQPTVDEAAPADDPVDLLDGEPSTHPTEPNPQPFADKPPFSVDKPVVEPSSSLDADSIVEPVTPEATQPTEQQPIVQQINNYTTSEPAAAKGKKDKRTKKEKKQKQPKPPKAPKAPKQPKNRSGKSPLTKIIITAVLTILLLAIIVTALWYFVFQPKQAEQPTNDNVDQTAQTVERTPENSAELAIEAIQTALHEELDDLYEEMVITPSSPDSREAILSPSYQVAGEAYSVSTNETYSLLVAPNERQSRTTNQDTSTTPVSIDQNFVDRVDQTAATVLATNNYTQQQNDDKFGAIYESADVVCSVMTETLPNQIVCINKSAYKTASDALKPFATAFIAENKEPSVPASFKNEINVEPSQTENYEIAEVGMINAVGLFYRQLGDDWHFFAGTQQVMDCEKFNTAPVKAAFAGEQCIDLTDTNNPTNKPTTVAEYYANKS